MKRIHLFEFEDLSWFPSFLRNYGTDFLQFMANFFDIYPGIVPILKKGLEKGETLHILDLASGGGGGWKTLGGHLKKKVPGLRVTLSDFYPNLEAFKSMKGYDNEVFDYYSESLNALDVPKEIKGLRTQFLSFHHFKPKDARHLLQNAVNSQAPIAIFEIQQRDLSHFIKALFSPISVLLTAPFIRPFKIGRMIFTYLIPLVPLFVWWDGVISVLRTYTFDEIHQLTENLEKGEAYKWESGKTKKGPLTITYTLGYPK
ncbi:hypothetical protein [Xanthovirga aplysinae]|uniref:hypothetical protein n=1 Tax=Xanthovirga aplysinae TaxID=2529853 RepID=UPI0012BCC472|nr:hypothetical protein [Xanthovirga aplysinae]MTI29499.1 hypothetical protein [Xanthovirga aplysinae]